MNKIKKSVVDVGLEDLNDIPDYTGNKNKIVSVKNDESGPELINSFSEWATSTSYNAGIIVKRNYSLFLCKTNHTSGIFATNWITNGHWVPLTDYPGIIKAHPVIDKIPEGWSEGDGFQISRTTYEDCFAMIGSTYGDGDGSTTFHKPNYAANGDFLRHYKSGVSEAIGTHQDDAGQIHAHTIYMQARASGTGYYTFFSAHAAADYGSPHNANIISWTTGGRTADETRPINNAVIFIIKIL